MESYRQVKINWITTYGKGKRNTAQLASAPQCEVPINSKTILFVVVVFHKSHDVEFWYVLWISSKASQQWGTQNNL